MDRYQCDGEPWLLDSGATVVVVSSGDSAIVETFETTVWLKTSQGWCEVFEAIVNTPIGKVRGLVSEGSPRLMPAKFFIEFGKEKLRSVTTRDGVSVPVEVLPDGIPVLRPISSVAATASVLSPPYDPTVEKAGAAIRKRRLVPLPDVDEEPDEFSRNSEPTHVVEEQGASDGDSQAWGSPMKPTELAFAGQDRPRKEASKFTHLGNCGCDACKIAKMQYASRKSGTEESEGPKLVADLCTGYRPSVHGHMVILVLKEVSSGMIYCRPVRGKTSVAGGLREFVLLLRDDANVIKDSFLVVTDQGGEFESAEWKDSINSLGGVSMTVPKGRHNGSAESAVRLIVNGTRTLIWESGLPPNLWNYAATCFVHNYNILYCPQYLEAMQKRGSPDIAVRFGELAWVKLDKDLRTADKAEPAGQPIAVLGFDPLRERRGLTVAFMNAAGKIGVTSVDVGPKAQAGVVWGEHGRMAFRRIVRDLKGETIKYIEELHGYEPPTAAELADWHRETPLEKKEKTPLKKGALPPIVPDRRSTCKRCRGNVHKTHDYSETCQRFGVAPPRPKKAAAGKRAEESDGEEAAEQAVPALLSQLGPKSLGLDAASQVAAEQTGPSCTFHSVQESLALPGAELFSGPRVEQDPQGLASRNSPDFEPAMKAELERVVSGGRIEAAFHSPSLARMECEQYQKALVTRKMTSVEKSSEGGRAAHSKELGKLASYGLFGAPVAWDSVTDATATVCGVAMLSHVKGAEHEESRQEFKGRCVVLGDQLKYLVSGAAVRMPDQFWLRLQSELVALEEARIIDCVSIMFGYEVQSIDLESAYLQAAWPSSEAPHFLQIPQPLQEALPDHLKPHGIKRPVWPMLRCGYGHPASGHIWIEHLLSFLLEKGWVEFGTGGSRALLRRGRTLIGVYVDDVKATGPKEELRALWSEVAARFKLKADPALCKEFLAIHYLRVDTAELRELRVSQVDYCVSTIVEYETVWGVSVTPQRVPQSASIRPTVGLEKTVPQRRHQSIIGRLLWLARCSRPDLSESVSGLGSRVACWSEECEDQLRVLIGYLKSTSDAYLSMQWPVGCDDMSAVCFEAHTDSDYHAPRSQSGYTAVITSTQDPRALLQLHWGSKRQPLTCDSTTTAEIVASHLAVKGCVPVLLRVREYCALAVPKGVVLRVVELLFDNAAALIHTSRPIGKFELIAMAFRARLCWLRDLQSAGILEARKVDTKFNRADPGTKLPHGPAGLMHFCTLLGIVLPPMWHTPKSRKYAHIRDLKSRVAEAEALKSRSAHTDLEFAVL